MLLDGYGNDDDGWNPVVDLESLSVKHHSILFDDFSTNKISYPSMLLEIFEIAAGCRSRGRD